MPHPEVLVEVIALTLVGLFELWLGLYFITKYQRTVSALVFGALIISIGLWVLFNGGSLLFTHGDWAVEFSVRMAFVAAAFIFPLIEIYTKSFPIVASYRFSTDYLASRLIAPTILSLFVLFSDALVVGVKNDVYRTVVYGSSYWIYVLYIVAMYFYTISKLAIKRNVLSGQHREIIQLLFTGVLVSGFLGIFFIIILGYFFNHQGLFSIGPISSIIWTFLVARKILQKE